jgi:molybdopterin synthase catalytic subunit
MHLEITITRRPIDLHHELPRELASRAGAIVEFAGVVRGEENNRPIAALEYEAYSPMAENVMRRIVGELALAHPCLYVRVTHRIGVVPVGEAAIQFVAASAHRGDAFAMLTRFMDLLKMDVPIWKRRALTATELTAAISP